MLDLPPPVATYFASESSDPAAVAACFTPDGIVADERHTHVGHDAITAWSRDAIESYEMRSEPFHVRSGPDFVAVRARVNGAFPGAPIDLIFTFTLRGDLIERLDIAF